MSRLFCCLTAEQKPSKCWRHNFHAEKAINYGRNARQKINNLFYQLFDTLWTEHRYNATKSTDSNSEYLAGFSLKETIKNSTYFFKGIEKVLKFAAYLCALIAVSTLIFIIVFVLVKGLPHITITLLFGEFTFSGAPTILPSIIATLMVIVLASLISFPLGIATAIFLNEYTQKDNRLVKVVRTAIDILGGIPSIIYGLFGMILFCQVFRLGTSIIAGCFTVSLMTIPVTVRAVDGSN